MTADLTPATDTPVHLNVAFALLQAARAEDSDDQYEIQDRITAEVARRRGIAHPADSIPDLMRQYGNARYAEAMEGERGTYFDSIKAEVHAEEAFTRVLEMLAERDATIAQLREELEAKTAVAASNKRHVEAVAQEIERAAADLVERGTALAEAREQVAQLTVERDQARGDLDMYRDRYFGVQGVLDKALGPNEEDGMGEGIVADVMLLAAQRDEARDEAKRKEDLLAVARRRLRDEASGTTAGGDDRG